ncbi:MAG: citrate synthase [Actinobacteria bacterium]|nr:citrate synthase [Actinomycetota bacterium]
MTSTTVGDLMADPVATVAPEESLEHASRSMTDRGIGALVVVGEGGGVVGIVTERDVLHAVAHGDASVARVADWMTPAPRTVAPDLSPAEALSALNGSGYRHLPVVDGRDLLGIVSSRDLLTLARIEPAEHPGQLAPPRGLEGVVVAETTVGDVRGQQGFYHYRQYSATELARHRTFEDVWYLLVHGRLPTGSERGTFASLVASLRGIPPRTAELLPRLAGTTTSVVDVLRTTVSLVGAELGIRPWLDLTDGELEEQGLRLGAVVPTIAAAIHRLGRGDDPVEPRGDLGHAANYLYMIRGAVPRDDEARALERYLIATIDHGLNASTFTARVITSTGADLAAALTGAIGAMSGPLHGGAPSRALGLLDEIGAPERTEEVVRRKVGSGERIMGFGHRVYKTQDPRAVLLRETALEVGGERARFAAEVERTVIETLAELKPGRELYANVEYYAGVIFEQVGLPPELFTPTFVSSRTIGWVAHVLEQARDNRLIRPSARYVGEEPPQPVPPLDGS